MAGTFRLLLIFFGISSIFSCFSQVALKIDFSKSNTITTDSISLQVYTDSNVFIFLPTKFGLADFSPIDLPKGEIEEVMLVYTSYKLATSFSQENLNHKRIEALLSLLPSLAENTTIKWTFVEQTIAQNAESAAKLYHGFILKVRHKPTTEEEIKTIESAIYNDSLGKEICKEMLKPVTKIKMMPTGNFVSKNTEKQKKGIVYKTKGLGNSRIPELKAVSETKYLKDTICRFEKSEESELYISHLEARNVYDVLNTIVDIPNTAVVCDVTASMAKYSLQLLIWQKQYKVKGLHYFSFFNDGDNKPDYEKAKGNTGGIYSISSTSTHLIDSLLLNTMRKGNGGDIPENDLEAVLNTIATFPEISSVLLIADNDSEVKDISLLSQITKPVSVILCGTEKGINTEYLDIARSTKGSVFTEKSDFYLLHTLPEGGYLELDGRKYLLRNNRFEKVKR